MTREEFVNVARAIRDYYPKETILPTDTSVELWFAELRDIPYQVAAAALRKWVQTNKWSPTIAEIREMAAAVTSPDDMDWSEAWAAVRKAISHYGRSRQSEALNSLPYLARTTVERIGFLNLCSSENQQADRATFRFIYESLQRRENAQKVLSPGLKNFIQRVQLNGGEGISRLLNGGGSDAQ